MSSAVTDTSSTSSLLFCGSFARGKNGDYDFQGLDIKPAAGGRMQGGGEQEDEIELSHPVRLRAVRVVRQGMSLPCPEATPLTPETLPSFLLAGFPALPPSLPLTEEASGHDLDAGPPSFWLEVNGIAVKEGEGEEGEGGVGRQRVPLLPSTQITAGSDEELATISTSVIVDRLLVKVGREGGRKSLVTRKA
ncbi:hypothetical protein VYU27_009986 [Nannochloropsis oceanica]